MTERPVFTEELRSVLLAHTFDAPAPQATIDAVLAETVGAETVGAETVGAHTAGVDPVGAHTVGVDPVGRGATLLRTGMAGVSRGWAASRNAIVGVAMAAALVVLAVGAVKLTGESNSASSKSSAGLAESVYPQAGPANASALPPGAHKGAQLPVAAGTFVQPPLAAGTAAAAAGSGMTADQAASAAVGLAPGGADGSAARSVTAGGGITGSAESLPDITAPPGGSCRFGSLPTATVQVAGSTVQVREAFCLDAAGNRTGSVVQAEQHENATSRVVDTLLAPSQDLQVQSMTVTGGVLVVRVVQAGSPAAGANGTSAAGTVAGAAAPASALPSPPYRNSASPPASRPQDGTVSDYRFSTTDGLHFVLRATAKVAAPCTLADLEVTGSGPVAQAPGLVVEKIRFTHRAVDHQVCALSGYPTVSVQPGSPTVSYRLSGPAGGVRTAAYPPTILLGDGQVATAIVEYRALTADGKSCGTATTALIGLPAPTVHPGGSTVRVPVSLGPCELSVHPVVAGTSGSTR